jgi:hypothetical protein
MTAVLAGCAAVAGSISHASSEVLPIEGGDARDLQSKLSVVIGAESERDLWLAIFREEREASDAMWRADVAHEEAQNAARDRYPKQDFTSFRLCLGCGPGLPWGWHWGKARTYLGGSHFRHEGRLVSRDDIIEWYDRPGSKIMTPELRAEGEQYKLIALAEFDAWQAECDAIDCELNLPALHQADDAASKRWADAQDKIVETPAASIVGVAVKLAFWAATGDGQSAYDHPEEETGDTLAVFSAWKAAVDWLACHTSLEWRTIRSGLPSAPIVLQLHLPRRDMAYIENPLQRISSHEQAQEQPIAITEPVIVKSAFITGGAFEITESTVRWIGWEEIPRVDGDEMAERRIMARVVMTNNTAREFCTLLRKALTRDGH